MNLHNGCIEQRLALAIVAIKHLDQMGCTVTDVDVMHKLPVLRIECNPNRFLRGVMKTRSTINGVQHITRVALVEDCLVEWPEQRLLPVSDQRVSA